MLWDLNVLIKYFKDIFLLSQWQNRSYKCTFKGKLNSSIVFIKENKNKWATWNGIDLQ